MSGPFEDPDPFDWRVTQHQRWRMSSTGLDPHPDGEWVRFDGSIHAYCDCARAIEQRDELLAALKDIADPFVRLRADADELAKDATWLRDKARAAIAKTEAKR